MHHAHKAISIIALDVDPPNILALPYCGWLRTVGFILGTALLFAVIGSATLRATGGGQEGWDTAASYLSRFSSLIFLIFFIAGPVARLFPTRATEILGCARNDLITVFLTAYAASLAFTLVPAYLSDAPVDAPTMVSCLFAGLAGAALAFSANWNAKHLLGGAAEHMLRWIGTSYFWLMFVSEDLRHIYGPHRPDSYYDVAILLFIGAILLRFANAFKQRVWAP